MDEPSASRHKVTQLLADWSRGDDAALAELTPLVYEELRRLAHHYMEGERADHTLVHRLATAPIRRSHSSRFPRKPSSQAVLKLSRAVISRGFPFFVSLTFR